MTTSPLPGRYAQALKLAIVEPGEMENVLDTLNALSTVYQRERDFRNVLANPTLDVGARGTVLDSVLGAFRAPDVVSRLAHLLLRRNRIAMLPAIAAQFDSRVDEWLNRVKVTVVTAVPLTVELRSRLLTSLERFTGKVVRLDTRVDPAIIGGLIVNIWQMLFDLSLRTRLGRLRRELLADGESTNER